MKLWTKLLRDIRQSYGQFIAFALIVAVGAFFYAGLSTLSGDLGAYAKNYFQQHRLSDLNVSYDRLSPEDAAKLSDTNGVQKLEGRYTFEAAQTFGNKQASLTIHSIPEPNEINTPAIVEGRLPTAKNEMLLDSHYAKEHGLPVGSRIEVRANDRTVAFTISGLGENVEHAKINDTQDHAAFGFGYIAEASIPAIADGMFYNEILIDAKDGYDIDAVGEAIASRSEQLRLPYLDQVSKERSFSYAQITATIANNRLMSKVIPLVLFAIEALILFLALSRMIDAQRTQIGIMKAIGVKNRSILLHYMGYPVLVSLLGSIVGCLLARVAFIPMIAASNARSYSLPDIRFALSPASIILPIASSCAFGLLACYLGGKPILRERAAQAMRPKPPRRAKKLLIERIPGMWQRLSYSYKLILRNIFLNKRKALASSAGVVVSTVLLITAFGTQSSLLTVANQSEKVYAYDLKVDYAKGTDTSALQLPSGIENHYSIATLPVAFVKGKETENASLVVTGKDNGLIRFFDDDNREIALEDDGVLVPRSYADVYRISKGDSITIRFTAPEFQNKTVEMKVSNISAQYSNPSFYISPAYLKSFGVDYRPTSLLVEAASGADLADVRRAFEQDHRVNGIADREDLKKSARYIVKQNSFVFILFILSAAILSFGAIYTISSINIHERNRELATLRVLGYTKRKINRLVFFENLLLTAFAVIVTLPISGYMYALVVKALSSTHQQIPDRLTILTLSVSVLLAFLLTATSNWMLRRKVNRIDMIGSLKSVE